MCIREDCLNKSYSTCSNSIASVTLTVCDNELVSIWNLVQLLLFIFAKQLDRNLVVYTNS